MKVCLLRYCHCLQIEDDGEYYYLGQVCHINHFFPQYWSPGGKGNIPCNSKVLGKDFEVITLIGLTTYPLQQYVPLAKVNVSNI